MLGRAQWAGPRPGGKGSAAWETRKPGGRVPGCLPGEGPGGRGPHSLPCTPFLCRGEREQLGENEGNKCPSCLEWTLRRRSGCSGECPDRGCRRRTACLSDPNGAPAMATGKPRAPAPVMRTSEPGAGSVSDCRPRRAAENGHPGAPGSPSRGPACRRGPGGRAAGSELPSPEPARRPAFFPAHSSPLLP